MKLSGVSTMAALSTQSLQGEIQRTVMGVFLVLVISYSVALGYYFTAGSSSIKRLTNIHLETTSYSSKVLIY